MLCSMARSCHKLVPEAPGVTVQPPWLCRARGCAQQLGRAAGLAHCPRGLLDGLHSRQGSLATFLVGRDQQLPQQLGGASNLLFCLGTAIE